MWVSCLKNIPSSLEGSQWTPAFMGLQWPSCRNVGVTLSFWWWGASLTNHIYNNDRTWLGWIYWFSSVIGEKLRCPWPLVAEDWLLSQVSDDMAWCRENINLPNVHFVGRFGTISQLIWWLLALNKKLRFQNLKVPFQLLSCVGPSCALPMWSFRHWLRHLWPLGNNENENVFRFINYWLLMPVKHWLTTVSLVNLTDMTLAVEDANSNLLMLSLLPMLTLERVLTIRWWQLIACLYIVSVVTLSGALNIGFVVADFPAVFF